LEPWLEEGNQAAFSVMMLEKTSLDAVSARIIRLAPGGHTALHRHERAHHVLLIEGKAHLETDEEEISLDNILVEVPSGVNHRFVNKSDKNAVILVLNIFR
jgi:quercetin dioxygenase-like cupin family protein